MFSGFIYYEKWSYTESAESLCALITWFDLSRAHLYFIESPWIDIHHFIDHVQNNALISYTSSFQCYISFSPIKVKVLNLVQCLFMCDFSSFYFKIMGPTWVKSGGVYHEWSVRDLISLFIYFYFNKFLSCYWGLVSMMVGISIF